MKYDNVEKNKIYEKTSMSNEEKKELLANCLKKRQEILSDETHVKDEPVIELTARRNEKMNKNDGIGRIFKTVAVAAFAVVATGAIINGVGSHNNKSAKESVVATSEKMTDKVEETTKEVKEPVVNNEEVVDNSTYVNIGGNTDCTGRLEYGEEKEIGGALFKYDVKNNNEYLYVKGKDSKKYKEICDYYPGIYTNGEYVYYESDGLMRYDIKNDKLDKVDIIKADKNAKEYNAVKGTDEFEKTVDLVRNDIMYMSFTHSWLDDKGVDNYEYGIYTYNMVSGESKLLKENRQIISVYNNFFITGKVMDGIKDDDDNLLHESYIEMMDGDELKEVLSVGECTKLVDTGFTYSKKYFYFVKYEKLKDGHHVDESEFKLIKVSKDKAELEEVVTLTSDDFVNPNHNMKIVKATDEYCIVEVELQPGDVFYTDENSNAYYRYTFATKKIEDIDEQEYLGWD